VTSGSSTPGPTGSATLATVRFQATALGPASVQLTLADLTDPPGTTIPANFGNTLSQISIVNVVPTATPTSTPTQTPAAHAACATQPGGSGNTCLVVDVNIVMPGLQSARAVPATGAFTVALVARDVPPSGLFSFDATLEYDTTWLDAGVPSSPLTSSGFTCAGPPAPAADFDANAGTGDARITCILPSITGGPSGDVVLATYPFTIVGSGFSSLTIAGAFATDATLTELVSCNPVNINPGAGCQGGYVANSPSAPSPTPTNTFAFTQTPTPADTPPVGSTPTPSATSSGSGCTNDVDCDGYLDPVPVLHAGPTNTNVATDNCTAVSNAGQLNSDGNFIALSPTKPYNDLSVARSDALGDACDDDDDNDGLTDADELTGVACGGVPTNALNADTDGDRMLDGAECLVTATDPTVIQSASPAICQAAGDVDGDAVTDAREICYYETLATSSNSDGDARNDGCEVYSINGDQSVNVVDLQQIAAEVALWPGGNYPDPGPVVPRNFDVTKNGTLNVVDLQQVAAGAMVCP
jgi:hypothetical protein